MQSLAARTHLSVHSASGRGGPRLCGEELQPFPQPHRTPKQRREQWPRGMLPSFWHLPANFWQLHAMCFTFLEHRMQLCRHHELCTLESEAVPVSGRLRPNRGPEDLT